MKRLTFIVLTLVSLIGFSSSVFAASSYWQVNITTPHTPTTKKTFGIGYTVLSTNDSDNFTVDLYQTGVANKLGEQAITGQPGKAGGAGVFTVTVPSTGTFHYYITAKNSNDPTPKTTDTVTVTVNDPPAPIVTTVTVASATTSSGEGGSGGGTTGTDTNNASDGTSADSTGQNLRGVVSKKAASTDNNPSQPAVLGTSATASNDNRWWYVGIAILLLLGITGYYVFRTRQIDKS